MGQFPCVGAIGAVAGAESSEVGLLWFDAHDDCETPETTTSGFVDGMGLAILTGQCFAELLGTITNIKPLPGDRVVLLGARDVSSGASRNLVRAGIRSPHSIPRATCRTGCSRPPWISSARS